jgi:hypothetical protein
MLRLVMSHLETNAHVRAAQAFSAATNTPLLLPLAQTTARQGMRCCINSIHMRLAANKSTKYTRIAMQFF